MRKIDFDRLNHILIPARKDERDALRQRARWLIRPLGWLYDSLTPLGMAAAICAPLALALGMDVLTTDAHLVFTTLVALTLLSLATAPLFPLPGVSLTVQSARRVSVGEEMTFALVVKNSGPKPFVGLRTVGPFLPWDGRFIGSAPSIACLRPDESLTVHVRATFRSRGEHHLDPFRIARLLPSGLAHGPSIYSDGCKFLVVPRIADVRRVSTPQGLRHQPGGVALASRTGESMDLAGVRPYRPGDPVRDIHARSWARLGQPVVREYQQEYFSRIGVIVDTDLGPQKEGPLLEGALSLCAGVIARLSRGEALIDLLVAGPRVHPLTLGRSLGTLEQALDLLACVQGGPPLSVDGLLTELSPYLTRLSCVVLIVLRWDEARVQLQKRILGHGTTCLVIWLREGTSGPKEGIEDSIRVVPLSALAKNEVLFL